MSHQKNCTIVTLFLALSIFAQNEKKPVLFPYELGGRGDLAIPKNVPEGIFRVVSDSMELRDLPKEYPYRTIAYFENGQLFTLHVLFGETTDGFSLEAYQSIREILIKLWDYPSITMKGRREMGSLTEVWETRDFRIEWIYKNQVGSETKKMGWLFIYNRNRYIESY